MTLRNILTTGLCTILLTPMFSQNQIIISQQIKNISEYPQLQNKIEYSAPPYIKKLLSESTKKEIKDSLKVILYDKDPLYISKLNEALDEVHTYIKQDIPFQDYDIIAPKVSKEIVFERNGVGLMHLVKEREREYTAILDNVPKFTAGKSDAGEVHREVMLKGDQFSYQLLEPVCVTPGKFDKVSPEIRVMNTVIAEYLHLVLAQKTLDKMSIDTNISELSKQDITQKYFKFLKKEEGIVHATALGFTAKRFGKDEVLPLLEKYDAKGWNTREIFEEFTTFTMEEIFLPIITYAK